MTKVTRVRGFTFKSHKPLPFAYKIGNKKWVYKTHLRLTLRLHLIHLAVKAIYLVLNFKPIDNHYYLINIRLNTSTHS